ncbi:hypothetical protein FTX61_05905 [Nitriliruptoraceae bacterium ZYF776]|nr:hypothetical protein [Profundirhabdus halotolerans]
MTRFEATNRSRAVVPAERQAIWDVLTDAPVLAQLTPLVDHIDDLGEHWCWHLAGISALGVSVAPTFRERMTFEDGHRLEFAHDPPEERSERAGADGTYELADADGGTRLAIEITIHVELPLPRTAGPAVRRVMETSMTRTGERFGRNLLAHLGVRER